jgi:hypothetical protein
MVRAVLARAAFGVVFVAVVSPVAAAEVSPFERERAAAVAELEARRGTAEAIAPLVELISLEEVLPPGPLEPALRAAAGAGSHPLVAAQATFHLARLLDQRGDEAGAKAARASLGLLSRFWVIGPFGEGRAGF